METQAYCVKCRKTQTVENATVKESGKRTENGPGHLSGVRDESNALSAEREEGVRAREDLSTK